jgi:hypothetical protein
MFRDEDARSNISLRWPNLLSWTTASEVANPLRSGAVCTACRRARYVSIACSADRSFLLVVNLGSGMPTSVLPAIMPHPPKGRTRPPIDHPTAAVGNFLTTPLGAA